MFYVFFLSLYSRLTDFLFFGFKISVDGDFSHEIKKKKCSLLRRKAMKSLDSVLRSREIILPTKVCIVKPVVTYSSHVQM